MFYKLFLNEIMAQKEKKKHIELSEAILVRALGLEQTYKMPALLKNWLAVKGELNEMEQKFLEKSCLNLVENANAWNEEELKMHFISLIIFLANIQKPLRVYFDREISAEVGGISIKSEADMLVSKGIGELIETPYFLLHEYKREKKYKGDPIGQMLGGMLIAQGKNQDGKPVHGCYVQGRFWFFSLLMGKQYAISQPLNSAEFDQAARIVFMLRHIQTLV